MTYLLIFTCLCVMATCLYIVRQDYNKNTIKVPKGTKNIQVHMTGGGGGGARYNLNLPTITTRKLARKKKRK